MKKRFINVNKAAISQLISSDNINLQKKPSATFSYLPLYYCESLYSAQSEACAESSINFLYDGKDSIWNEADYMNDACYAEKLASLILKNISNGSFSINPDGTLTDKFYADCVSSFKNYGYFEKDDDILVIHAKQIVMMLKSAGIIVFDGSTLDVSYEGDFRSNMRVALFRKFWNEAEWTDLFPSMPEYAAKMQEDRSVIAELILQQLAPFGIDNIVSDYLMISGLRCRNEILLFSFFDFTIFTWFENFGVIEYVDADGVVSAELTQFGRTLLSSL